MRFHQLFSLITTIIFAVVGLVFLFIPSQVLVFFNCVSTYLGMPQSPVQGVSFYLILAVAYMYMVTLLAYSMYRHPQEKIYPFLLANAKLASSAISLYLFLIYQPYLIYIVNGVVDGGIGLTTLYFLQNLHKLKG
jgi:hypothetical protein